MQGKICLSICRIWANTPGNHEFQQKREWELKLTKTHIRSGSGIDVIVIPWFTIRHFFCCCCYHVTVCLYEYIVVWCAASVYCSKAIAWVPIMHEGTQIYECEKQHKTHKFIIIPYTVECVLCDGTTQPWLQYKQRLYRSNGYRFGRNEYFLFIYCTIVMNIALVNSSAINGVCVCVCVLGSGTICTSSINDGHAQKPSWCWDEKKTHNTTRLIAII